MLRLNRRATHKSSKVASFFVPEETKQAEVNSPERLSRSLTQVSSVPMLKTLLAPKSGSLKGELLQESSVKGGEYTVRPNRRDSMAFLTKLVSQHQPVGSSFQALMSPPDAPFRK